MKLTGGLDADPCESEREGIVREVGGQAIWSLSSCKLGMIIIPKYLKKYDDKLIISLRN